MSLLPTQSDEYKPLQLSQEELENPADIFTSFFESFDLLDVREHLREALSLVLEKKFQSPEYSTEEDNVRFFYEKLEKVMEAAWVMKS